MAWLNLNQSFNSLKGQITNFATEVLAEAPEQDTTDGAPQKDSTLLELEEKCKNQELEIAALKKLSDELQASLQSERLTRHNGVNEEESSWYWDPPPQTAKLDTDAENNYKVQIRSLQNEISTLKEGDTMDLKMNVEGELNRLREENQNLTTNLEDLDSQHQLAMDRLLSLKKELQKNFEVLKQDHEELKSSNDEYAKETKFLLEKIGEKDEEIKSLKTVKADYDTLHHKYQNLERIYALLRENAEKFQEENQELHEEVFKLQEEVTKLEHDLEIVTKNSEVSATVPKEKYDEVLKELHDLKERRNANQIHLDEINIDDNAKSVIENLKHEINDLRHQLTQKEVDNQGDADSKLVKAERIMQLYNKYVNFEIPVDYVGEIPSVGDNTVIYKLESVFKTVNSFKKEIDNLEHQISEKNLNFNHLQTQIDDLTTENDFLTTDIQHFERELNEMKKNNDFLLAEITNLKNTSKLEPIIEMNHEDNLAKLEIELADVNRVNKSFESEIKRIETELEDVRKEKVSLQESLTDLKTKYTTMLSEIDMCKNKTEAADELEKSVSIQQSDNLKKATDEIDELKKKLNTANSKNEQLSIDIHIIENDKVLLTNQVADLKNIIEEKASAHKELEALKLALDHKLLDFEMKLDEVILHKCEIESEKLKLEEQVMGLESKLASTQAHVPNEHAEKLLTEKKQLEEDLSKLIFTNSALKESLEQAKATISIVERNNHQLKYEVNILRNKTEEFAQIYMNNETVLKHQLELLNEKKSKLEIINKQLKTELSNTDSKIVNLEQEFEKLLKDIDEKDELIDALNITIVENKQTITNLSMRITDLENKLHEKDDAAAETKFAAETQSISSTNPTEIFNRTQEESNNPHMEITMLQARLKEIEKSCDEYKNQIEEKNEKILELTNALYEAAGRIETHKNNNEEYEAIVKAKEDLEKESKELQKTVATHAIELTDLKRHLDECRAVINNTTAEKAEMINLINSKHDECLKYHYEIQRLNQIVYEQNSDFAHALEENERILQSCSPNCSNCENLRTTLIAKDEIILNLNQNATELKKLKAELANASEVVRNLTEKCDITDRNLATQQEVVKKLTAENAQLSEKEQNSTRELERLRRHLVETEESYTQELMTSEQKLTECQSRLHQVEERAKQTSTVYTSNSIRANQEVETLRTQIKLLEKQREEVQVRLSEAEDARSRSEAALTNLQIVLEQFQLDKERDIHAATEKIRNKMEDLKRQNCSLQDETAQLNKKLDEALAGLQAATRLGDQLETKTAQINDLKEQVRTLQTSVAAAEERYHNAISNQQDKVDKNLVKNLVINYVVTVANSKTQVLRILSTVLDFNQKECEKLGLVRSAAPDSLAAEFVKFLQNESTPRPAPVAHTSMAQSRSTTPAVSRRSSTTGPNPTFDATHKRNQSSGSNNLLFTSLDHANVETSSQISQGSVELRQTLDTGVNQTRNNEGAILKHVLRDM